MTYEACVSTLLQSPRFGKKNGLENMRHLIEVLGLDLSRFKFIHVAGTNGKGSVCAMLASMFAEEGIRTGLFTSPHLIRINERFKIDGKDVDDSTFVSAYEMVANASEKLVKEGVADPTFFELMLAVGLVIFDIKDVAWIILETGLGGRLDATNAISGKEAAVITRIGLDHTLYLGDTLEEITAEKAGIIEKGRPVVYWHTNGRLSNIIVERCSELSSQHIVVDGSLCNVVDKKMDGVDFFYKKEYYNGVCLKIGNSAKYMLENAAIALETAALIAPTLSIEAIKNGLEKFRWPGRMEWVGKHIIMDGAHNIDGVRALCDTLDALDERHQVHLLFACMQDKAYMEMVQALAEMTAIEKVWTTTVPSDRSVEANELAMAFRFYGKDAEPVGNTARLLAEYDRRDDHTVLCCAGSLYLIGEIKKSIGGGHHD